MGLFDFFREVSAEAVRKEAERQKYNRQDALLKAFFDDKKAQQVQKAYYAALQKVEDGYRALNKIGDFGGKRGSALIANCVRASNLFLDLMPIWAAYEQPIPRCPVFAKHAMVHEKRGEYDKAAAVCVLAIRSGLADDGTKGGMPARLKRMIKKGNLSPAQEVLDLLP